jgi:hypothetical protein
MGMVKEENGGSRKEGTDQKRMVQMMHKTVEGKNE